MSQEFQGTQPGAYLLLAEALVHIRDDQAFAAAADIIAWEDHHGRGRLDANGLTIAVKAGHVLAEGALSALNNTE
jgi:hypothetical protein